MAGADAAPAGGADDVRVEGAGWLVAVLDARERPGAGPATSAWPCSSVAPRGRWPRSGSRGLEVAAAASPTSSAWPSRVVPWHTNRVRIAELGAALATTSGVLAKIARDVVLLAQTEVGEVREEVRRRLVDDAPQAQPGRVDARPVACARLVRGLRVRPHGGARPGARARGRRVARRVGGAVRSARVHGRSGARGREALAGLEVDAERMRANLDATGGLVLAERGQLRSRGAVGRAAGHEIAREAAQRVAVSGRSLADELRHDQRVGLSGDELDALLDPTTYLGSAEAFVDRALELYAREAP